MLYMPLSSFGDDLYPFRGTQNIRFILIQGCIILPLRLKDVFLLLEPESSESIHCLALTFDIFLGISLFNLRLQVMLLVLINCDKGKISMVPKEKNSASLMNISKSS